MAVHANLLGFDGDVWAYIQSLESDVSRRLICFVLNGVDRAMDFPEQWPHTILDCVYLAAVINDMSMSGPAVLNILRGPAPPPWPETDTEPSDHLSRVAEARCFIAKIGDATTRAIVEIAFDACVTKAARDGRRPIGVFDMLFFAVVTTKAFSDHEAIELILIGEGARMDWE